MAADATTGTRRTTGGPDGETELGVDATVLGAVAYLFGFVSGVVLLVLEENDYVRHHAAQSVLYTAGVIVAGVAVTVLGTVLGLIPVVGGLLDLVLWLAFRLGALAGAVFLMYEAYSGERYELPVLGAYVDAVEEVF